MELINKNLRHQLDYAGSETNEGKTLAWLVREALSKMQVPHDWSTAYIEAGEVDFDIVLSVKRTDDEIRQWITKLAKRIAREYKNR
jgi:predicted transcriptional regulator